MTRGRKFLARTSVYVSLSQTERGLLLIHPEFLSWCKRTWTINRKLLEFSGEKLFYMRL